MSGSETPSAGFTGPLPVNVNLLQPLSGFQSLYDAIWMLMLTSANAAPTIAQVNTNLTGQINQTNSNLAAQVSNLQGQINSINGQIGTINSHLSSLDSQINTINGRLTNAGIP